MIVYDVKEYEYIINRYYRKSSKKIDDIVHGYIFQNYYDETLHFLCSWFCERDVKLLRTTKFDLNNCYFYDFDNVVCEINQQFIDNVYNVDVIFDVLDLSGVFIHKYCEYTYPVGKIYKGDFILIGCDENSLYIPNPINSIEQLTEQNNITKVYHTKQWSAVREYDDRLLNYYMVIGCNT